MFFWDSIIENERKIFLYNRDRPVLLFDNITCDKYVFQLSAFTILAFFFLSIFIFIADVGDNKRIFYVYADETRLSEGTNDIVAAMEDLFSIHFVHNFMYATRVSKFLEFLQEYFLKIITLEGSKSTASRVGNRQRIVQRVISALSNFNVNKQP